MGGGTGLAGWRPHPSFCKTAGCFAEIHLLQGRRQTGSPPQCQSALDTAFTRSAGLSAAQFVQRETVSTPLQSLLPWRRWRPAGPTDEVASCNGHKQVKARSAPRSRGPPVCQPLNSSSMQQFQPRSKAFSPGEGGGPQGRRMRSPRATGTNKSKRARHRVHAVRRSVSRSIRPACNSFNPAPKPSPLEKVAARRAVG